MSDFVRDVVDIFWSIHLQEQNCRHKSPLKTIREHQSEIIHRLHEKGHNVDMLDDQFFNETLPYLIYESILIRDMPEDYDMMSCAACALCELIEEREIELATLGYAIGFPRKHRLHLTYTINSDQMNRLMLVILEPISNGENVGVTQVSIEDRQQTSNMTEENAIVLTNSDLLRKVNEHLHQRM